MTGLARRGPPVKLSDTIVLAILDRARSGETQTALAREFNVSQGHICNLIHGRYRSNAAILVTAATTSVRKRHIAVLAKALGLTVEALEQLGEQDEIRRGGVTTKVA